MGALEISRKAFRILFSLYIWGLVLYQIFPVEVFPSFNYATEKLYPKPVIYTYSFAYDVKTAFSNHAGSLKNLLKAMDEEGIDLAFGDFPEVIEGRLLPKRKDPECYIIRVSEISLLRKILHVIFEIVPKYIVGEEYDDLLSTIIYRGSEKCYLVAHDDRVAITTSLGFEIPPYRWILGKRKNILFSRSILEGSSYPLDRTLVKFSDRWVFAFAYSEKSFYFPGEETVNPFKLVVETDIENPLIKVFRDGRQIYILNQDRVNIEISERGFYSVQVLSYKFKVDIFYFGLRTVALVSPFVLM